MNTPCLDKLADDGLRLLNFHTAAACSPTRAMVLSGTDHHLGGLGCMIEYKDGGGEGQRRWGGKVGQEGFLNDDVCCLAEVLEDNGYYTALSGKVRSDYTGL